MCPTTASLDVLFKLFHPPFPFCTSETVPILENLPQIPSNLSTSQFF